MFILNNKEAISNAKIIVLPSISVGNCGQLAADLLIATFKLKRVAVYYGDSLLPFGAIDENGKLLQGCELFGDSGVPFVVVQISSLFASKSDKSSWNIQNNDDASEAKPRRQVSSERRFLTDLLEFLARESKQSHLTIVNMASGSAASLSDPEMRTCVAHYAVNGVAVDAFIPLERRSFQRDSALFYLPGSGFSHTLARMIASRSRSSDRAISFALHVVGVYADRGDCRAEAARLCCGTWHLLHKILAGLAGADEDQVKKLLSTHGTAPEWRAPAHWAAVYAEEL